MKIIFINIENTDLIVHLIMFSDCWKARMTELVGMFKTCKQNQAEMDIVYNSVILIC